MPDKAPLVRVRLSIMMFLEFLLWASWYVPIGGYMNEVLRFSGAQIGWIYATTAIGAIVSPMFVGYIADRFFATERVLAVLHLIGAACLLLAAGQTTFPPLMTLLVVNALCFMPTLGLANSLAFRNTDDPDRFSRIAVWGTIGWIVSGWIVEFLLGGAVRGMFFYLAGVGAGVMGLYCLTLPHTPPKGAAGGDVLGLGALRLLANASFLIFALCVFLISIPLTFYFTWGHAFLTETNAPRPTALLTLSQFSEIVVMIIMPWFIGRIGLKYVLVIGMAAWAVRFALFSTMSFPLVVIGLLVHGFCYCFVFVAAFIYVSKKAPPEMSASAQSLVSLLMWGLGMLVGTQVSGLTGDNYPPVTVSAIAEGKPAASHPLPAWKSAESDGSLTRALGMADQDQLPKEVLEKLPESGVTINSVEYPKSSLLAAFDAADKDHDSVVTAAEWHAARIHRWPPIWLWPGALAAVVCLMFLAGGRDPTPAVRRE